MIIEIRSIEVQAFRTLTPESSDQQIAEAMGKSFYQAEVRIGEHDKADRSIVLRSKWFDSTILMEKLEAEVELIQLVTFKVAQFSTAVSFARKAPAAADEPVAPVEPSI